MQPHSATRIPQLKSAIASLQGNLAFADGGAYRQDLNRINAMKTELYALEREAEAVSVASPFDLVGADSDCDAQPSKAFDAAPGVYFDLSNEDYHAAPGISKSGLDLIASNPSNYLWSKSAPVDDEKTDALDDGQALHTLLLEPEEFEKRFLIMPELNLRTNDGKDERDEFLTQAKLNDQTVLTHKLNRKLQLMRESVMAHPTARMLMEAAEGVNESSIFWIDEETGELCKCRPDRRVRLPGIGPVVVDVKKCADITRFEKHAEEFRYHVQDAFYRDGFKAHYDEKPEFWFLVVDSTISAGRYRVDVVALDDEWQAAGHRIYREDLIAYHHCRTQNDWEHIRTINRPRWAKE